MVSERRELSVRPRRRASRKLGRSLKARRSEGVPVASGNRKELEGAGETSVAGGFKGAAGG